MLPSETTVFLSPFPWFFPALHSLHMMWNWKTTSSNSTQLKVFFRYTMWTRAKSPKSLPVWLSSCSFVFLSMVRRNISIMKNRKTSLIILDECPQGFIRWLAKEFLRSCSHVSHGGKKKKNPHGWEILGVLKKITTFEHFDWSYISPWSLIRFLGDLKTWQREVQIHGRDSRERSRGNAR